MAAILYGARRNRGHGPLLQTATMIARATPPSSDR